MLTGTVEASCRELLQKIATDNDFMIASMEVMPDHVHLFVSAHPKYAPGAIAKKLKGISGKWLLEQHPELRKVFRRHQIWNPSTYYGTAGDVSRDVIKKYIDMQKSDGEI